MWLYCWLYEAWILCLISRKIGLGQADFSLCRNGENGYSSGSYFWRWTQLANYLKSRLMWDILIGSPAFLGFQLKEHCILQFTRNERKGSLAWLTQTGGVNFVPPNFVSWKQLKSTWYEDPFDIHYFACSNFWRHMTWILDI